MGRGKKASSADFGPAGSVATAPRGRGEVRTRSSDFGPTGRLAISSRDYERALVQMGEPRSKRGQAAARLVVYGTLFLAFLFLLINFATANNNRMRTQELSDMVTTQYNPSFKVRYADLGRETIESWYGGGQPTVDLAQGLSWPTPVLASEGIAPVAEVEDQSGIETEPGLEVTDVAFINGSQVEVPGGGTEYQERLTYTALVNGLRYRISLTFGIPDLEDYDGVPVLMGPPTIQRPEMVAVSEMSGAPEGWSNARMSDAALQQLTAWARAWTTNDGAALKQITQDSSAENAYIGLPGGWRFVDQSLNVIWSYRRGEDAVVQMEWEIKVPDSTFPDPDDPDRTITVTGPTQTQRMEVLVQDWDTGLPAVVAWGQVGSYTTLEPLMNAVPAEEVAGEQQAPADEGQLEGETVEETPANDETGE